MSRPKTFFANFFLIQCLIHRIYACCDQVYLFASGEIVDNYRIFLGLYEYQDTIMNRSYYIKNVTYSSFNHTNQKYVIHTSPSILTYYETGKS